MKSSTSFKVLPVSLAQVFLLECNLRFSSIKSFEKVSDILSICAAATSPMNCTQIFHTINALKPEKILWQEFASRYEFLKSAYVYHSSIIKINIVSYAGYLIYVIYNCIGSIPWLGFSFVGLMTPSCFTIKHLRNGLLEIGTLTKMEEENFFVTFEQGIWQ